MLIEKVHIYRFNVTGQEGKSRMSPLVHMEVLRWAQVPSNMEFQPMTSFAGPLLKLGHRSQSQTALSEDIQKKKKKKKESVYNKSFDAQIKHTVLK